MLCKSLIVLCCVLIVLHYGGSLDAAGKEKKDGVVVEKFTNNHNGDHYTFSYSLSDGQFRYEQGGFKNSEAGEGPVWVVNGMYGYVSPDGKFFRYQYTADENGYRQSSDKRIDSKIIDLLVGQKSETGKVNGRGVGNRIDYKALISLVG